MSWLTSANIYLQVVSRKMCRQANTTSVKNDLRKPFQLPTVWACESYVTSFFFFFIIYNGIYNMSLLWELSRDLSKQKVHMINSSTSARKFSLKGNVYNVPECPQGVIMSVVTWSRKESETTSYISVHSE